MSVVNLSLATIGSLNDGIAEKLVDREIERAVADMDDRGEEDGKPRKVVITLEMVKVRGQVVAHVLAEAKLPPRKSGATLANVKQAGSKTMLQFRDDNADNPDQPTLADVGGR